MAERPGTEDAADPGHGERRRGGDGPGGEERSSLGHCRRVLDDVFFCDGGEDPELIPQLRRQLRVEAAKEDLAAASGISDEAVLERLARLGIRADTLCALTLVPLVQVAWADGEVQPPEREVVLQAASDAGIRRLGPGLELLRLWLDHPPPADLLSAWRDFVGALCRELGPEACRALRDQLLARARRVAESAGERRRSSSRTSPAEESVLTTLAASFDPPT